jgi:hypothetical protein
MKKPKLFIELIPTTCHFSNVRTTIKQKEWDKIRFISYKAANNKCEICGETGKNQGYKHNLECHEIWEYNDETHVQKLIGLISLCPRCHQVKHIGRAIAMGRQMQCFTHLSKVNKWTTKEIQKHIDDSFGLHKERSKHQWILDISILKEEPYLLKLKPQTKRIFEIKKFKKKRKRVRKPKLKKRPPRKS